MRLTIRKCEHIENWYVIERAEHDGRAWMEPMGPGAMALRLSARFSDADVEGTGAEMLAIADAIERRTRASFKRCMVDASTEPVRFASPRNSQRDGECSLAEAVELARSIRSTVPASASSAETAS